MNQTNQLSKGDVVSLLQSEVAGHHETKNQLRQLEARFEQMKDTVQNLRKDNLILEKKNRGDTSDDMEDYLSRTTTPAAHYVQGLQNQVKNLKMSTAPVVQAGIMESERRRFEGQVQVYREDLAQARRKGQDLDATNQNLTAANQRLITINQNLRAEVERLTLQSNPVNMSMNNFAAGSNSLHHHHVNVHVHQNTPTAPPTPAQAMESLRTLTITEDTDMVDNDGIGMPLYKDRCGIEMNTGVCEKPRCAYLHQKQLDKYPAEAIATLHANHQDARRAKQRKLV
jgi:hypothetical protein